jgi:hypothetical protein
LNRGPADCSTNLILLSRLAFPCVFTPDLGRYSAPNVRKLFARLQRSAEVGKWITPGPTVDARSFLTRYPTRLRHVMVGNPNPRKVAGACNVLKTPTLPFEIPLNEAA